MTGFGGIFLISAGFKVSKSLYFQFQWYNISRVLELFLLLFLQIDVIRVFRVRVSIVFTAISFFLCKLM